MGTVHTLSTLFSGAGAPPAPWTGNAAGGGAPPVQGGGSLAFPGVLLGGSDSNLEWVGTLDFRRDRIYLQWKSLIGRPGTVELDLSFSAGWGFAMQLRNGSWTIQLYHGASVFDLFVGVATSLDVLSWSVWYDSGNTLHASAGPDAWSMVELGSTGSLPNANAAVLNQIDIDSRNMETFDVAYGQSRLIAFNAWNDPLAFHVPPVGLDPLDPTVADLLRSVRTTYENAL